MLSGPTCSGAERQEQRSPKRRQRLWEAVSTPASRGREEPSGARLCGEQMIRQEGPRKAPARTQNDNWPTGHVAKCFSRNKNQGRGMGMMSWRQRAATEEEQQRDPSAGGHGEGVHALSSLNGLLIYCTDNCCMCSDRRGIPAAG